MTNFQKIPGGARFSKVSGALYSASNLSFGPTNGFDPFPGQYYRNETLEIGEERIAQWGVNNTLPVALKELLQKNDTAASMLLTKVNFAIGERMYAYKEVLEPDSTGEIKIKKTPVEIDTSLEEWLEINQIEQLIKRRATDYYFSGNAIASLVLAKSPKKYGIAYIDHIDSCYGRMEEMKKGKVNRYFISDDWTKPKYNPKDLANSNIRAYPAFNERKPLSYKRSILWSREYFPGEVYYGIQPWHYSHNWMQFANSIPVWMKSNIENSYNIKYHIIYPDDYFEYLSEKSEEEREKEKSRFFDEVDKWLAGAENTGKAFYTPGVIDKIQGKFFETWKIIPIKNDIKDTAWVEAYKTSKGALTSGWDLNPALANIPHEGKFSTSGSEQRIAYQIHLALKVQAARKAILEPLTKAYKVNHKLGVPGFEIPGLKFGFINKNITTLAENPSGMTSDTEPTKDPTDDI